MYHYAFFDLLEMPTVLLVASSAHNRVGKEEKLNGDLQLLLNKRAKAFYAYMHNICRRDYK